MPTASAHDEVQRLAALRKYVILDTPPDEALDDITRLAAHVSDSPMALITLIDSHRQWFKSRVGIELRETARDFAFCAHAIARPDQPFVVHDALNDERFRHNPLVTGDPKVRFYYGLPLVTREGHALGTLCVMDRIPRQLTDEQVAALRALRRNVVAELELRRVASELRRATEELEARTEGSVRESEARFRALWETTSDAVLILGADSIIRYASPAVRETFGYQPQELEGRSIEVLQPERLRERHRYGLQRFIATGERTLNWRATESTGLRRDGHEVPVEIAFSTMTLEGERMFVGFIRDITARKVAEDRLTRLNRVYAVLSGINTLIVRTRDRETLFEGACRIAVEHGQFGAAWVGKHDPDSSQVAPVAWLGADAETLQALTVSAPGSGRSADGTFAQAIKERRPVVIDDFLALPDVGDERIQAAIKRGYRSTIALPLIVDGEPTAVLSLLAREPAFFNDDELRLLWDLAGDVSFALEVIGKSEKLDFLASYDGMTLLPNRALLQERLTQALERGREEKSHVGLVALDVQNFRGVNETLGRHAGDALLKELARRLERTWPQHDGVARIANDVFAGFFPDVKEASEVASFLERRLLPALSAPFQLPGAEISVAILCGVAVFPGDGGDAETLLKNAESALKKAKRSSARYLFYQPSMNATVARTLLLGSKLRTALEKQQFLLHYQPRIRLCDNQIVGLEALLRWQDPQEGLVSPAVIVPILEETGLINAVGLWALHRAASDHCAWRARGLSPPRVAVNISAAQLMRAEFLPEVREVLEAFPGPGAHVDFELTESVLLEDIESSTAKLRQIREMGVRVAIDDFGTGHSSLLYLANLPLDALKVDRSFVARMMSDAHSMTIVSTIVSLARSLGLKVVAEGVELPEQQAVLGKMGCDEAQGYLYARPMPAVDIATTLANRAASTVGRARVAGSAAENARHPEP